MLQIAVIIGLLKHYCGDYCDVSIIILSLHFIAAILILCSLVWCLVSHREFNIMTVRWRELLITRSRCIHQLCKVSHRTWSKYRFYGITYCQYEGSF
jgi:hypothetical protein